MAQDIGGLHGNSQRPKFVARFLLALVSLRQNGVGTGFVMADAILPKGHDNSLAVLDTNSSFYVWLGADQNNGFQPLPDFMLMMRGTEFQPRSFITMRNQRGYGTQKNWMAVRQELLYYIRGNPCFNVEAEYTDIPKILRGYYKEVNYEFGRSSGWIHQLATSTQQRLTPPEKSSFRNLLFTADGSELYFVRVENSSPLGTLYRIPVLGGSAKKLRDDIVVDNIMLSSDGGRLAFARRNLEGKSEIVLANTDGVEERVLLGRSPQFLAWAPDGEVIAFSSGNAESGGEKMGINEVRLGDGAQREISSRKWNHVGDKSWLPDGSGLIVSARDLKTAVKQLWFVAYPSGEARSLSNDLDNFIHVSLTADARMLVAEQLNLVSEIWSDPLANVAGGQKVGVWGQDGLSLMPDGRVLYSALSSSTAQEVWVMNADGAEQKQLTFDSANDFGPMASPDGRYVVFASTRTGHVEIWRMNPDGGNLLQLTHTDGAKAPSVAPDGRWVIYLSSGALFKIPIEGGEAVQICKNAVGVSSVAPDGRLIAHFDQGKDFWGIAVSSFQDGAVVKRFEVRSHSLNNTSLKWTPDGKALLYSASSDGVANIWAQPLDGSPARQVTDFKADGIFRFDVSGDGKKLICARGGWKRDIVLVKNLR